MRARTSVSCIGRLSSHKASFIFPQPGSTKRYSTRTPFRLSSLFGTPQKPEKIDELDTHQLMVQAGLVRQVCCRVTPELKRLISRFLVEGGQKVQLPLLLPSNIWRVSGRWDQMGQDMFRLHDRKGSDFCLAPTHEELITQLFADAKVSHRQMPARLYQIGLKYRDEPRPRHGLLRGREFMMKDMYSFDKSKEEALQTYNELVAAYQRVFQKLELPVVMALADSGLIGGDTTHEFHVISPLGEDVLLCCDRCDNVANVEKAKGKSPSYDSDQQEASSAIVNALATATDMLSLAKCLSHSESSAKVHFVLQDGLPTHLLLVSNKTIVNPLKIRSCLHAASDLHIVEGKIETIPLYMQHIQSLDILIGEEVATEAVQSTLAAFSKKGTIVGDFRTAEEGDLCASNGCKGSGGRLRSRNGLEVGHIFFLGTRYSAPFKALVDSHSQRPVEMGCYGLGITRILAAMAGHFRDGQGLVWPASVAPYRAVVIPMDASLSSTAIRVAQTLDNALGGDAIAFEDRDEHSPGRRMKEAQFLGFPFMVILGRATKEKGLIEVEIRQTGRKVFLPEKELVPFICGHHSTLTGNEGVL